MNIEELKEAREQWYKAFYLGDSEKLSCFESNDFSVVSSSGVQSKKSQIEGVQRAVSHGDWFPAGTLKEDQNIAYRCVGEFCIVNGRGTIVTNGVAGTSLMFTELWWWSGTAWLVENLHYTELSTSDVV